VTTVEDEELGFLPGNIEKKMNPNNPNKNQAIQYDQKNDQVISYNPIEYRINNLEKQIAVIEKRLTNHYHILPTSGMKDFEDSHPYYNRKLN